MKLSCYPKKKKKLRSINVPKEPQGKDAVQINFVLPSGERLIRKFSKEDTFQNLKDFLDTRALPENGNINVPENYSFFTDYPRKTYNLDQTLSSVGFSKEVIRVEENI